MAMIWGVSNFDQTDGSSYIAAVNRSIANQNIKAGFIYFNASTSPTWADRCDDQPDDHDLWVSTKKYTNDTQWVSDHTTFASQIPARSGKVYMVANEEPEPDMTSTEFKRRWDLIRSIYEGHPYAVMAVQLSEFTFNPASGRNWADWVPSYITHVGVSIFAYTGDVQASDVTPHYELVARVVSALKAGGKSYSFSSVGAARLTDGTHTLGGDYCKHRSQWLYDVAEEAMLSDAKHFMWWDGDITGPPELDYRFRIDSLLADKWTAAVSALSIGRQGPEFRAEAHNSTGTGASVTELTVTIPTSGTGGVVKEGDLAYLFYQQCDGGLLTNLATPSGWTTIMTPTALNGNIMVYALAYKKLVAADIGATVSFGVLTAARRQNISVTIYSDAKHDVATAMSTSGTGTLTPPVPGVTPGVTAPRQACFAIVEHPAVNTNLIKNRSAYDWTDRIDHGTSVGSIRNGSQYVQDKQESTAGPFSATTFQASFSSMYSVITITMAYDPAVTSVPSPGGGEGEEAGVGTGAGGPPPEPTPHYTYLFCDLLTNQVLGEFPLYGVYFERRLSGAGSFDGTILMTKRDPDDAWRKMVLNSTIPTKTAVYIDRGGTLVWGGVIWTRTYQSQSKTLQLNGQSFESYLFRRAEFVKRIWQGVDRRRIAIDLVTFMQSVAGSNIGIITPAYPAHDPNYASTRTINAWDLPYYGEYLTEMSAEDPSFDWTIEVAYDATGAPAKYFQVAPMLGAQMPQSQLVFPYPVTIPNYYWSESGSRSADHAFAVGSGEDAAKLIGTATDGGVALAGGYPRLDTVTSHPDVTRQATANAHALTTIEESTYPTVTPTISVRPDQTPVFGTYGIGTEARFLLDDDARWSMEQFGQKDINLRIIGWNVRPPEADNAESVDLVLSGQDTPQ